MVEARDMPLSLNDFSFLYKNRITLVLFDNEQS